MGIRIICEELPDEVKGLLANVSNGNFTITINSKLNIEQQNNVYLCAMKCINDNKAY